MQCNEVWGGNQAIDTAVQMAGLDAWVYSRPYRGDDAGGDVHYVSSCATGRIARLLVADVSGHGSTVADVATALRGLMRRYMNYVDQAKLVAGLNVEFSKLAEVGTFATAIVATYWVPTDDLVLTNAGHPRPLVYRAGTQAWSTLDGARASGERRGVANIPLGITESEYTHITARLREGDCVLIYTDSLLEVKTREGKLLGEAGLLEVLNSLDARKPERLIGELIAAVGDLCADGPEGMGDDVTALLVRPNTAKPRGSLGMVMRAIGLNIKALGALLRGEPYPWPQISPENIGGAVLDRLNRRGRRARE